MDCNSYLQPKVVVQLHFEQPGLRREVFTLISDTYSKSAVDRKVARERRVSAALRIKGALLILQRFGSAWR